MVASFMLGAAAGSERCLNYEIFPYEMFSGARAYMAGPPEQFFEFGNSEGMHDLIAYLKDLGEFDRGDLKDNSLILGFIQLRPGDSRLVITDSSLVNFSCYKKLNKTQRETLMTILHRNEVEN